MLRMMMMVLWIFAAGCDRGGAPVGGGVGVAGRDLLENVREDVLLVRARVDGFPGLERVFRATRHLMILWKVEGDGEPMDGRTRWELEAARERGERVLSELARFEPFLREMEAALLELSVSLHRAANSEVLSGEVRGVLRRCRSNVFVMLEDLRVALVALTDFSVVGLGGEVFEPDFGARMGEIEGWLEGIKGRGI
jgi:hypothetical protein